MDELDDIKYNLVKRAVTTDNYGIVNIRDEAVIRYTIENAAGGNTVRVQGRLIGQATWVTLLDIIGSDSQVVDVSTYEEIQVFVFAYASLSNHVMIFGSSFDNVSSSGFSGDFNDLINIPTIEDEGVILTTAVTSIDFVGGGVTATNTGGAVTVTIPGGAGATFLTGTAVIDYASIAGSLSLDFAIAVTGAVVGDFVVLGRPADEDPGLVTEAFVSATDVVQVRAHNVTAVAIDQAAKTYNVLVIQP